jgi:hypothetical protein
MTPPIAARPIVTVCGWCADAAEQTASARAHGYDVSHGLCPACQAKLQLYAEKDAAEARA